MSNNIKVAIGSLNKAKNTAVRNILSEIWENIEFFSTETESGISSQPKSGEEAIEGAINRAKEALTKINDADYGIGLEGTVETNKFGMFLYGWVAIIDKIGKIGIGSSGKVLVPEWMKLKIDSGEEMGPIMQEILMDSSNTVRHSEGTCGILTNGMYTRVHEFEDAISCALSIFVAKNYYTKEVPIIN